MHTGAVRPCRSMCQHVQAGCEPLLHLAGYFWPEDTHCDKFPTQAPCLGETGIIDISEETDNDASTPSMATNDTNKQGLNTTEPPGIVITVPLKRACFT